MTASGKELADRMCELMSAGDINALVEMYATDAMVVLYSRIASGHDEIRELLANSLASHGNYDLVSIDQFRDAGALVMWDATVQTLAGLLQTTHVVVRGTDGLIHHHVPGIRGYWGM